VRIANVISCRPPHDYLVGAPWEEHAISCCRQYLDPVLASVPNNGVVVPLGATALGSVLNLRGVPGVQVKEFHGTVSRIDRPDGTGYWVVPTFHPSFLQRGKMSLLQIVTEDLRLADRIAQHGFTRSPHQLVVDPAVEWFAAWVRDHLARVAADPDGTHLSLDTEFEEKIGKDESDIVAWNAVSPITRVNGGNDALTGWTVPYAGAYIPEIERLLAGVAQAKGWCWLWNKYADWDHLRAAGHTLDGIMAIDGMWLWHYLQSDVFRGLGFVAPLSSDFGPWKHWAEDRAREGNYAAADGLQNWRTCMWCLTSATKLGLWNVFMRDWHDRDLYCLRPSHEMGVPIDRAELEAFHASLQVKLAGVLVRIKETAARGVLKPKVGYRKAPMVKCGVCFGEGSVLGDQGDYGIEEIPCSTCTGSGKVPQTTPPKSILGTAKKGGGEAKSSYMLEGVRLVEAEIEIDVRVCVACGVEEVGLRHQCRRKPKAPKRKKTDLPYHVNRSTPRLETRRLLRPRYFWQLPFNPDAPAQILSYLADQGIAAPVDKKTQRATTNKKALDSLRAQYKDDPFFQLQLDWKAVQKVDSTYAIGTLSLLDDQDRVHPEYAPIPSTLRDSAKHPNLTNVVADKSGPQSLAAGFRRCIVSRDGVPRGVSKTELATWEARWT